MLEQTSLCMVVIVCESNVKQLYFKMEADRLFGHIFRYLLAHCLQADL